MNLLFNGKFSSFQLVESELSTREDIEADLIDKVSKVHQRGGESSEEEEIVERIK